MFSEPYRRRFCVLIIFYLTFLSGTRYCLGGNDYYEYQLYFNNYPYFSDFFYYLFNDTDYLLMLGHNVGDFGFIALMSLIKTLGFNYHGFILIHAIIFYLCLYHGLKRYCKDWTLLIPVFMAKLFFYNTFVSMRQSLTIAAFFLTFRYIDKGNYLKYCLAVTLAATLHIAAVILYPVYFIRFFKITRNRLILISLVFLPTVIFSYIGNPFLPAIIGAFDVIGYVRLTGWLTHLSPDSIKHISLSQLAEWLFMLVLILLYYRKILKVKQSELMIKLFFILLPMYTIFRSFIFFIRLRDYFLITYGVLLGYIWFDKNVSRFVMTAKYKWSEVLFRMIVLIVSYIGMVIGILKFDDGHFINYSSFIANGFWIWDK